MAKIYADLIRKGLKTLEDVPERLRKQVEKILGGEAGTVLIFAVVYGLIYLMTARSYYHIVERK